MPKTLLAIDQGTTGSTAIVLTLEGETLGKKTVEFQQHFPKPGWVEHDADEIWRSVEEAMPDSGSVTLQLTVTGPVYQLFEPMGPVMVGVMTGAVLLILMVTGAEAVRPAPLVAEQVNVVPGVFAVRFTVPQPADVAMPDSGSVTLQLTVTSLV